MLDDLKLVFCSKRNLSIQGQIRLMFYKNNVMVHPMNLNEVSFEEYPCLFLFISSSFINNMKQQKH